MSAPYPERYPAQLSFYHWIIGIPLVLMRLSLAGLYLLLLSAVVLAAKPAFTTGSPVARRFRRGLSRSSGRIFIFLMGGLIRRRGRRPAAGSFVVSNHRSWLDALIYGAELGAIFVVHDAIRRWPLIGAMVAALGHIFIDRASLRQLPPVATSIDQSLEAGETVLLFPEAATADGIREPLLAFRSALLEAAVRSGRPLRCAALNYRSLPGWPDASVMVAWADWTPFFLHVLRMMMQPWFYVEITYLEHEIREPDRKKAATAARTAVAESLGIS